MSAYTEVIAQRVLELEARNRQLIKEVAKLRASRANWRAKAEHATVEAKHLAARNRVLLIDKANLIADSVVRS